MKKEKIYQVGETTVTRISELEITKTAASLYPEWDPAVSREHGHEFDAGSWDAEAGLLALSLHTWLVRTPKHNVLIDTAAGNDKPRPFILELDHLETPYLERVAATGISLEEIDFVMLTHLHVDHVGWNTRRTQECWRPTFPNAKYVMPQGEYAFYKDPANRHDPRQVILEDSVFPVIDAGMAAMVDAEGEVLLDHFRFIPSPGHSVGHMSISLESAGERALFGGDVLHSPFQVYRPEMNSLYCEQSELARASRRWALSYAADEAGLYFSTHFPESSAGRITRQADGFKWTYE